MSERSIKNFIPNLITLTGLCFGLSSIRFAVLEDFKAAVVCILIAAICDVLDGLFSRLLKTQSDLGAELDSLADFLSFGVAPGILVYFGILEELAIWGYLAVTAFIVFACLRLAIFNLNLPPTEDAQKQGYFLGVPTPSGAGLILLPLIHSFLGFNWGIENPEVVAIYTSLVGLLMVSKIPTFSLKELNITVNRKFFLRFFVGFVVLVLLMINFLWQFLSVVGILYIIGIPVAFFIFRKNRLKESSDNLTD